MSIFWRNKWQWIPMWTPVDFRGRVLFTRVHFGPIEIRKYNQ